MMIGEKIMEDTTAKMVHISEIAAFGASNNY
jgi:hypothetical protein